jgi:hypothetical protein
VDLYPHPASSGVCDPFPARPGDTAGISHKPPSSMCMYPSALKRSKFPLPKTSRWMRNLRLAFWLPRHDHGTGMQADEDDEPPLNRDRAVPLSL